MLSHRKRAETTASGLLPKATPGCACPAAALRRISWCRRRDHLVACRHHAPERYLDAPGWRALGPRGSAFAPARRFAPAHPEPSTRRAGAAARPQRHTRRPCPRALRGSAARTGYLPETGYPERREGAPEFYRIEIS